MSEKNMYVQDIVDFIMKSNRYNLALRNVGAKNLDLQLIGLSPTLAYTKF